MILYFVFILSILCYLAYTTTVKPKQFPPGPNWFPLVGCYQIKSLYKKKQYHHLVWDHLQTIYGSIIGIKLGSSKIVLVSGFKNVLEVLSKREFEGRPDGFFYRLRSLGERLGLVFVDGPFFREQKKFSLHQLRQNGLGRDTMNDIVTKEALEVVDLITTQHKKGPIKVQSLFKVSVLNTIWTLLAGHRFEFSDRKLLKLLELVNAGFRLLDMTGGPINQMPFLRFIAPSLTGYNSVKIIVAEIMDFLQDVVKQHKKLDNNNTFIGAFLKEIRDNEGKKDSTFSENQLTVLLEDLFMAGTETTGNTLSFMVLYLIKYPDVQRKIHDELDKVLGNQLPTMEYRDKLVYLEATIMEVQRHASPVPLTIPHRAMKDATLFDYRIPKDTIIISSLWSLHMDESYWQDPFVFKPERFIDSQGKIIQHSHFIPFGWAKRRCLGETLAKTTIFLFLSIILQKFQIRSTGNVSADVLDGVTLALAPFEVIFIPRRTGI